MSDVSHTTPLPKRLIHTQQHQQPKDIPLPTNSGIVHTATLTHSDLPLLIHPVNNTRSRFQLPIGDTVGLTKTGVHYCRLPPNTTSTSSHWHLHEDEWAYIVEAGKDSALLLQEQGTTNSIPLTAGDFLGFPAGKRVGHSFTTGASELVYLFGGSREPLDVSHYVESGQRRVKDRSGRDWIVNEGDIVKEI